MDESRSEGEFRRHRLSEMHRAVVLPATPEELAPAWASPALDDPCKTMTVPAAHLGDILTTQPNACLESGRPLPECAGI
jgi:hypothetical protein